MHSARDAEDQMGQGPRQGIRTSTGAVPLVLGLGRTDRRFRGHKDLRRQSLERSALLTLVQRNGTCSEQEMSAQTSPETLLDALQLSFAVALRSAEGIAE